MAILSKGKTFTNGELVTPQKLHELVDLGTVTGIVNADIAAGAAIADSKLAQISTAGKVLPAAVQGTAVVTADPRLSDARTPVPHTHAISDTTGLQTALDGKAASSHTHAIANVTGLQTALDGKQAAGSYAPATGIAQSAVTNLTTDLAGKAASSHTHDDRYYTETEIDTKLSGLPVAGHTHTIANVTGLQTALDGKQASGSYAPATGIAPSAITGTAVITTDSRLSDARTPVSHTHFDEVLQPGSIYSSASVAGGSVFELTSGVANGSAYSEINFHRGAAVGIATPYATFYQSGAIRGTISPTGASGVAYNTTSDYRLKTNLEPLSNAVARLLQIPARRFNWLADPNGAKVDGFLAHEAQAIVPECVTGHKDEVDAEGKPIHQGIDQSKLVPLLVAAVQELAARVAALEAR